MAFIQYSKREGESKKRGGRSTRTNNEPANVVEESSHTLLTCCHTIIRDHSVAQAGAGYAVDEEGNWYVYCCIHSTFSLPPPTDALFGHVLVGFVTM